MGLVVSMAMFLLALLLSSFLSLDLQGAGIAAGVYSVITALLSAFTAGYFAIKASAPELLFGDGTDIAPQDATLSGVITAAAIIAITTFTAVNGATSAIRTAGGVVGSTVSAVGSATGSVAGAVGSIASGASMAGVTAMAGQTAYQINKSQANCNKHTKKLQAISAVMILNALSPKILLIWIKPLQMC